MSSKEFMLAATGAHGLVGRGLVERAPDLAALELAPAPAGSAAPWVRLPPVDVTDRRSVDEAFSRLSRAAGGRPVVVVHLAALTDVRGGAAEAFEKVNVQGTVNVLAAAAAAGAKVIHISTDYVFSGMERKDEPYTEADRPSAAPAGAYAASKCRAEYLALAAPEEAGVAVARIAFPYGGKGDHPGLEEKLIHRFKEARRKKEALPLFRDQSICPSFIPDVARGLLALAAGLAKGEVSGGSVYHLVGEPTTPLDFGNLIQKLFGFEDVEVKSCPVAGTTYARNLWLSNQETRGALTWAPTPHAEALSTMTGKT